MTKDQRPQGEGVSHWVRSLELVEIPTIRRRTGGTVLS
jgi:hypothetical protein